MHKKIRTVEIFGFAVLREITFEDDPPDLMKNFCEAMEAARKAVPSGIVKDSKAGKVAQRGCH